ncbi:hypothetical protein SAPIO_CDS6736 [Scedosporium apiospermum]|uniref:Conidiation-specific protein 6 n=1 Tax=Pseudallescheria apiosperma TaxID=563466 RepID=A0A084G349_PSEDA|nr:uncharacterized protein SAPIO_CDS6736 [Scedosporium apiospermum]KEZ41761.1 hypothetical protein SAPIO_CDS6736 [Scedosporium apiospermum]
MEDRSNRERGLKAAIHNPHISKEAKQHARDALKNEFGEEINTPFGQAQREEGPRTCVKRPRLKGCNPQPTGFRGG